MFLLNASTGISANFEKMKLDNYSFNEVAHTMSFHCSDEDPIKGDDCEDCEHAIYDNCGKKKYEIQLFGQNNGKIKRHALVNKYGQRMATMTIKAGHRVFPIEVSTTSGNKIGTYHPHIYRHSKATIELDGTVYSIIKSKYDGKKVYYWVAKGTDIPLVQMNKGFRAHDFTFLPNCPESLENAVMLVRSYACYIAGIYN